MNGAMAWCARSLIGACQPLRPRLATSKGAKQELDFLLEQSVREHLLSDVPLGVWLSGGIDLFHHPALRRRNQPCAPQNLFHFLQWSQF